LFYFFILWTNVQTLYELNRLRTRLGHCCHPTISDDLHAYNMKRNLCTILLIGHLEFYICITSNTGNIGHPAVKDHGFPFSLYLKARPGILETGGIRECNINDLADMVFELLGPQASPKGNPRVHAWIIIFIYQNRRGFNAIPHS